MAGYSYRWAGKMKIYREMQKAAEAEIKEATN